jgi:hypothetical protein
MSQDKQKKDLVVKEDFALSVDLGIDPEAAALITAEDMEGYESIESRIPIVRIRQKEVKDEQGRILLPAGGFSIYDKTAKANNITIPDVDGQTGLLLSILKDQRARVYWKDVNDARPMCKSLNGHTGDGDPGGACASCPLSKFDNKTNTRPKCSANWNLLVFDHSSNGSYVLNLGPSGISPYETFKDLIERTARKMKMSVPLHLLKIKVTTMYKTEPQPHFIPVFTRVGGNDATVFEVLQALRAEIQMQRVDTTEAVEANVETDDDRSRFDPNKL